MEKNMRVYRKQRSEAFRKDDECEARIKGVCLYAATDLQHKKGRGKFFLVKKYQIKVCRACHVHIENHSEWAKENDLAVSRLTE
ncbi:hypothetical protein PV783_34340 [Chitinophaga sp. CC14]|uniref:hypothetical protein n=1 Tax=Chitinophaga sp. CC14 TaxID=3029199 RepID=UPI003B823F96